MLKHAQKEFGIKAILWQRKLTVKGWYAILFISRDGQDRTMYGCQKKKLGKLSKIAMVKIKINNMIEWVSEIKINKIGAGHGKLKQIVVVSGKKLSVQKRHSSNNNV